jgi:hypothetical protein
MQDPGRELVVEGKEVGGAGRLTLLVPCHPGLELKTLPIPTRVREAIRLGVAHDERDRKGGLGGECLTHDDDLDTPLWLFTWRLRHVRRPRREAGHAEKG